MGTRPREGGSPAATGGRRCGGCGGALHAACFARWMRRSCPLCRRPAADVVEDLDACTTIALALVVSGAALVLAWAAETDV